MFLTSRSAERVPIRVAGLVPALIVPVHQTARAKTPAVQVADHLF